MKKNILSILLFSFLSMIIFSCKNPLLIEESGLYEVSFETNGGTQISKYRTNCIKISPVTQKNNYVFSGWYDTSNFKNEPICFPYDINEDTILYAKWENLITVTNSSLNNLDLSLIHEDCIIKFEGEITHSTIETLAEKLQQTPVGISIDLSETKNLTTISARNNSTSFFEKCRNLQSIILPNTVTIIEDFAFYNCSLMNIYIPNSVKTVGKYAFYSCDNLKTIELESVENIGLYAFAKNNLESITLKNIHTIGSFAFGYSNNLSEIYIDAIEIQYYAFYESQNLTLVTIGKNAKKLEEGVFNSCTNLSSVIFENPYNWYSNYSVYSVNLNSPENNAYELKNQYFTLYK